MLHELLTITLPVTNKFFTRLTPHIHSSLTQLTFRCPFRCSICKIQRIIKLTNKLNNAFICVLSRPIYYNVLYYNNSKETESIIMFSHILHSWLLLKGDKNPEAISIENMNQIEPRIEQKTETVNKLDLEHTCYFYCCNQVVTFEIRGSYNTICLLSQNWAEIWFHT